MHKKICEDHDYCYIEMPEKDNKILKYYLCRLRVFA